MKISKIASLAFVLCLCSCFVPDADAKGGFSSGGRSSSFSSGRSSFSSGSSRSYSSPSRSTTTTTTTSRSYGGGRGGYGYGGGGYYHPMMMYPGFGMGYGYSNGLIEGLIIGNLMHPQGTTVYGGGGYSGGNALLYPDGRVVDQNGYQVGTYLNGQFTAVQGGQMVAQPAPAQPQQVLVEEDHTVENFFKFLGVCILWFCGVAFVVAFLLWIFSWPWSDWCDTITTTTTTTTFHDGKPVKGDLKRRKKGTQFFVIDPADKSRTWINSTDDMYEDANGRIWKLI